METCVLLSIPLIGYSINIKQLVYSRY